MAVLESPVANALHTIHAFSRTYAVVTNHSLSDFSKILEQNVNASSYVVIVDETVFGFYNDLILAFSKFPPIVVAAGELCKTREWKILIEEKLFSYHVDKNVCLVAIGGGAVCDLVGFTASTFLRGVRTVYLPTTLLAQVDASIGGKTAINVPEGKNLLGTYHQPSLVIIDVTFLKSLPHREYVSGWAEVIKMFLLYQPESLQSLLSDVDELLKLNEDLLVKYISECVDIKCRVVEKDERELTGERQLLNLGHTVGHALEAYSHKTSTPLLHGEAVSMGTIIELQISYFMGHFPHHQLHFIVDLFQRFGLPTSSPYSQKDLTSIMSFMSRDKKNNINSGIRMVVMKDIGIPLYRGAIAVPSHLVEFLLDASCPFSLEFPLISDTTHKAPSLTSFFLNTSVDEQREDCVLNLPGSKSITNRALLLAALGKGPCLLRHALKADDTDVCIQALRHLHVDIYSHPDESHPSNCNIQLEGTGGVFHATTTIDVRQAGTVGRFLTAILAVCLDGKVTMTASEQLSSRPMQGLLDALSSISSTLVVPVSSRSFPLEITGLASFNENSELNAVSLPSCVFQLDGSTSSQYISALLIASPYIITQQKYVDIQVSAHTIVSEPFIDMTIQMMAQFGIHVEKLVQLLNHSEGVSIESSDKMKMVTYRVPCGVYVNPAVYDIEGDATAASYHWALAALSGRSLMMKEAKLQGDVHFVRDILMPMGCEIQYLSRADGSSDIFMPACLSPQKRTLKAISVDMNHITDTFLTAAMLMAMAKGTSRISNIRNQRVKECNRIEAVAHGLQACGYNVIIHDDGLTIHGQSSTSISLIRPVLIDCFQDHRMAMSFSILSAFCGNIVISDRQCVNKTYPAFWRDLFLDWGITFHVSPLSNPKSSIRPIVLIGMRGAGKTTLAAYASAYFHLPMIDLDHYLVSEGKLRGCSSISEFVEAHGWKAFRAVEEQCFFECLQKTSLLACGGGIVESESVRHHLVSVNTIWIHKSMSVIEKELSAVLNSAHTDHRPPLPSSLVDAYEQRRSHYVSCARFVFPVIPAAYDTTCRLFVQFLEKHVFQSAYHPSSLSLSQRIQSRRAAYRGTDLMTLRGTSSFVCLTEPNYLSLNSLTSCTAGADAVEFRVDLLENVGNPLKVENDIDLVIEQYGWIRFLLHLCDADPWDACAVIYTVRTFLQGGQYGCTALTAHPTMDTTAFLAGYTRLLQLGVKLGVDMVDLEIIHGLETASLIGDHSQTQLLASHHPRIRTETQLLSSVSDITLDQMIARYASSCDILKWVAPEHTMVNFIPPAHLTPPRLLLLSAGPSGIYSRIMNASIVPCTHPSMKPAAAGQLTLMDIHAHRASLNMLPTRHFYLLGYPIAHSFSPAMHQAAFQTLGLPYQYSLFPAEKDFFLDDWMANPELGGVSITAPYKETLVARYINDQRFEFSEEVKAIGAMNTLVKRENCDAHSVMFYGDNTDWYAIYRLIWRVLDSACRGIESLSVLLLGAGGAAKAALYALGKIARWMRQTRGFVISVDICNRTVDKVSDMMGVIGEEGVTVQVYDSRKTEYDVIMNTLAVSVCESVLLALDDMLCCKYLALDMSYQYDGQETLFLQRMKQRNQSQSIVTISGLDVLLEQGKRQFTLFTGLRAPTFAMSEGIQEEIARRTKKGGKWLEK